MTNDLKTGIKWESRVGCLSNYPKRFYHLHHHLLIRTSSPNLASVAHPCVDAHMRVIRSNHKLILHSDYLLLSYDLEVKNDYTYAREQVRPYVCNNIQSQTPIGFTHSSIEKLGILSKAEELGLLSLLETTAGFSPAALASATLPVLVAAILAVVYIPDDSTALVVVQSVMAGTLVATTTGLFVGSIVLEGLQEAD